MLHRTLWGDWDWDGLEISRWGYAKSTFGANNNGADDEDDDDDNDDDDDDDDLYPRSKALKSRLSQGCGKVVILAAVVDLLI